jgi:hypothetical protein
VKLLVKKVDNDLVIRIQEESTEQTFDYVKMINALFEDENVTIDFDSIDEKDKHSINELFSEIKEKINK